MLRPGDFRCVESAVDVDERLAFVSETLCLTVAEALRMRKAPGNFSVAIDS